MRETMSITAIFQIFILFILLFTAIMCLTINNSNAFGVKDSIINVPGQFPDVHTHTPASHSSAQPVWNSA